MGIFGESQRIVRWIVAIAAVGTLLLVLGILLLQRSVLYPFPREARVPEQGTLLRIPHDTKTVSALFFPPTEGQCTVVFFHGNGEQLADLVPLALIYQEEGIGFFAVEYPGYGLDGEGSPSETTIMSAAEVALRYLHDELHIGPSSIVLQGYSLGTGVAVQIAARGYGSKLILLAAYTSIPDVAAAHVPWFPIRWLMLDRFDSASIASSMRIPVLLIHGTEDGIIPFHLGEQLSTFFPNARIVSVPGAGHSFLGVPGVLEDVMRFVGCGESTL